MYIKVVLGNASLRLTLGLESITPRLWFGLRHHLSGVPLLARVKSTIY